MLSLLQTKCEHYWPTGQKPHLHGNVTVTLVGSKQTEHFIQRTLRIGKVYKALYKHHIYRVPKYPQNK